MGKNSNIEYINATWNPWYGCHKRWSGCRNCYMYRDAKRFGFDPTIVRKSKTMFDAPLRWKGPLFIMVCSWSDFWIEEADAWRLQAISVMQRAPHHAYIIPTKRPERMVKFYKEYTNIFRKELLPRLYFMLSVSTQKELDDNINYLMEMPRNRWLSLEPLLEEIDIPSNCDGVIVGCESGPNRRPFNEDWVRKIRSDCDKYAIKFFYKQGIRNGKIVKMPKLDGQVYNQRICCVKGLTQ